MCSVGPIGSGQTRLSGLVAQHRGRKARANAAALEAKVLEWTRRGPNDGSTHWSSRRLARKLGLGHMSVARIWRRHGLQPHRLRHFMASNDPAFEAKAADIIGLYLAPPAHAAVFCVDEKSAIQALDRLDPVLPLSPGRAERHGFEYFRHGTLSLCRPRDQKRPGHRKHCEPLHQPGVCPLCPRGRSLTALRQGNPPHLRQPLRPQNQTRGSLTGRPSKRVAAVHPHLRRQESGRIPMVSRAGSQLGAV